MTRRFKKIALFASQRLPRSVVQLILKLTLHRITTEGDLDSYLVVVRLTRIALVSKRWKRAAYEQLSRGWWKFTWRSEGATEEEEFSNDLMKAGIASSRKSGQSPSGGLEIVIKTSSELEEGTNGLTGRDWKADTTESTRGTRSVEGLLLMIDQEEQLEIARRYPRLRRLAISATRTRETSDFRLSLQSRYFSLPHPQRDPLSEFPTFLVRLDLKWVNIVSWDLVLPHLKTLNLTATGFGPPESKPSENIDLCRRFFSSFPSLEALAINQFDRVPSETLTFLTSHRLSHLFLAIMAVHNRRRAQDDEDVPWPFHECIYQLLRHFRARIKHLTLPPRLNGKVYLDFLLTGRDDESLPLFLRSLETVKLSAEEGIQRQAEKSGRRGETNLIKMERKAERYINRFYKELELSPLTYEYWQPDEESDEPGRWDPIPWW
ncbi:hypothetical protein JCM5350_007078 [Sporobolomyces pararoseus]